MVITTLYHVFINYNYQSVWYTNAFMFVFLAIMYLRGITMLRVIDRVRYLIAMILQVFFDVLAFMGLLFILHMGSTKQEELVSVAKTTTRSGDGRSSR